MNSRISWLLRAALAAAACAMSPAFADPGVFYVLSWGPSTSNTDGTPLSDLAGYYVYTGDSPDTLLPTYFVVPGSLAFVLRYAPGEVHYVGVTAVNVDGAESTMTAVVSTATP